MSQTARMVRPQAQKPARRRLSWEVLAIIALLAALWGSLFWYAIVRVGGWAQ